MNESKNKRIMGSPSIFMFMVTLLMLLLGPSADAARVKGAYYLFDSFYDINSIDGSLFTHIYYAFANISFTSYTVIPANTDNGGITTFSSAVKSRFPSMLTLLSIGGGGDPSPSPTFAIMAADAGLRQSFMSSAIQLARSNGFDGLDLDWEYPSTQQDMANFATLLTEWKAMLQQEAQSSGKTQLLLTAAVYYSATITWPEQRTYPATTINTAMDWVNLMAYDFHGTWEDFTGAHTALYDPTSDLNGDYGVNTWLDAGLDSSKLVYGMATYGYYWLLADATNHGIAAPADTTLDDYKGIYIYDQIKSFLANAVCVDDTATQTAYCYGSPTTVTWVGYDSQNAIARKANYVKTNNLAGHFFWKLGDDQNYDLATQASLSS